MTELRSGVETAFEHEFVPCEMPSNCHCPFGCHVVKGEGLTHWYCERPANDPIHRKCVKEDIE